MNLTLDVTVFAWIMILVIGCSVVQGVPLRFQMPAYQIQFHRSVVVDVLWDVLAVIHVSAMNTIVDSQWVVHVGVMAHHKQSLLGNFCRGIKSNFINN